jgi:hypothetical protein
MDGQGLGSPMPEATAAVEGSVQRAPDDEADLDDAFKKQLRGMQVCLTCGPGDRFVSGKTHKSRSKHAMRPLSPEERAQEITWYREVQGEGQAARLRQLEEKRRDSRKRRASVLAEGIAGGECSNEPGAYKLDFGKHAGKEMLRVWRTEPTYFAY